MEVLLVILHLILFCKVQCNCNEQALDDLQQAFFEYLLKENPEFASSIGDKRYDDQVHDYSIETMDRWKVKVGEVMTDLQKIPRETLTDDHKTDYDIFNNYLQTYQDGYKWRTYHALTPVHIMSMPSSLDSSLVDRLILTDHKDFDNFIKRIQKFPLQISQMIDRMQKAIELNTTLHRVSMERVPGLLGSLVGKTPEKSFLYKPFKTTLDNVTSISDEDKTSLRQLAKTAIENYTNSVIIIKEYISNVYLHNTRPGLGLNSWKNGENLYKDTIKYMLSLNTTAEKIHNLGVKEVERISAALIKRCLKLGIHGNVRECFDVLKEDKQYYLQTGKEMIEKYNDIIHNIIEPKLPLLLKGKPKAEVIDVSVLLAVSSLVKKVGKAPTCGKHTDSNTTNPHVLRIHSNTVEIVRPTEADGVFASYVPPPTDGSKPGTFYLNTFHPEQSQWYNFKAIALHETNPGHHFQIVTAMESNIPQIRRNVLYDLFFQIPTAFPTWTTYVEGWGLYSEYLGEEMGVYKSDIEMIGRYSLEILRACRLVVDTGLHHYNWTRNKAIEYLTNYTAFGENDISFEVDRYVSMPAQALTYKIGEIKFKELRKKAEEILGNNFDVRDFHSTVIRYGPMSFSNLETVLDRWINTVKSSTSGAGNFSVNTVFSSVVVLLYIINVL